MYYVRFLLIALIFLSACTANRDVSTSVNSSVSWSGVEVAVLPHHMITRAKVEEFYGRLQEQYPHPDRIVIISPNHFNLGSQYLESFAGSGNICFHASCVPGGVYPGYRFLSSPFLLFDGNSTLEHGIGEHFSFIARYFSGSVVIPVVLQRELTPSEQNIKIAETLVSFTGKTLVLVSVDFSHHVDERFARFHDVLAVDVLKHGASSDFTKLEVDCRNCLALGKMIAEKTGKTDFALFARTSVDSITGKASDTENTTHVFGFFTGAMSIPDTATGVFAFAGDTHFARGIELLDGRRATFLPNLFRDFHEQKNPENSLEKKYNRIGVGFDYFVANLEATFDTENCENRGQGIILRMKGENIWRFMAYGINMWNLANNHSDDCGNANFRDMHTWFQENGIPAFGDAKDGTSFVWTGTIRGERFAMVGANSIETPIDWVAKIEEIRSLTASGYLVVANFHWGKEYSTSVTENQRKVAHDAIDAGARLVIGHHPHVVEPTEVYKKIPIYYSLGNFVFDQDFPETLPGLITLCEISRIATHCEDMPFTREKKTFAIRF